MFVVRDAVTDAEAHNEDLARGAGLHFGNFSQIEHEMILTGQVCLTMEQQSCRQKAKSFRRRKARRPVVECCLCV